MSEHNGISLAELDALAEELPTNITDPETRREIVRQILWTNAQPEPEPEPIELPQAPALPRVLPPVARRHGRIVTKLLRAWSVVRVLTSHKVDLETYAWRENACRSCPFMHRRMRRTRRGVVMDEHCSKCGCPDWKYSRNTVRNEFSGWLCPERRHPGPYPEDDLKEHLEACGYDPKAVFGGGGCTGCGCGKAKAGG